MQHLRGQIPKLFYDVVGGFINKLIYKQVLEVGWWVLLRVLDSEVQWPRDSSNEAPDSSIKTQNTKLHFHKIIVARASELSVERVPPNTKSLINIS